MENNTPSETAAGELQLHEFQSVIFRNTRLLRVWLPPGYNQGRTRAGIIPFFISTTDRICSIRLPHTLELIGRWVRLQTA